MCISTYLPANFKCRVFIKHSITLAGIMLLFFSSCQLHQPNHARLFEIPANEQFIFVQEQIYRGNKHILCLATYSNNYSTLRWINMRGQVVRTCTIPDSVVFVSSSNDFVLQAVHYAGSAKAVYAIAADNTTNVVSAAQNSNYLNYVTHKVDNTRFICWQIKQSDSAYTQRIGTLCLNELSRLKLNWQTETNLPVPCHTNWLQRKTGVDKYELLLTSPIPEVTVCTVKIAEIENSVQTAVIAATNSTQHQSLQLIGQGDFNNNTCEEVITLLNGNEIALLDDNLLNIVYSKANTDTALALTAKTGFITYDDYTDIACIAQFKNMTTDQLVIFEPALNKLSAFENMPRNMRILDTYLINKWNSKRPGVMYANTPGNNFAIIIYQPENKQKETVLATTNQKLLYYKPVELDTENNLFLLTVVQAENGSSVWLHNTGLVNNGFQ